MRAYIPTSDDLHKREVYRRAVSIIRDYPYMRAKLNEARKDVLLSSPLPPDGQPRGEEPTDITPDAADKLLQLDTYHWRVLVIEQVLASMLPYDREVIADRYWMFNAQGILQSRQVLKPWEKIDKYYCARTMRRRNNEFIFACAKEFGEIF